MGIRNRHRHDAHSPSAQDHLLASVRDVRRTAVRELDARGNDLAAHRLRNDAVHVCRNQYREIWTRRGLKVVVLQCKALARRGPHSRTGSEEQLTSDELRLFVRGSTEDRVMNDPVVYRQGDENTPRDKAYVRIIPDPPSRNIRELE
jgi:hypothetical protein